MLTDTKLNFLLVILGLVFCSCEQDQLPALDRVGPSGEIAYELRYQNDEFIGRVDYHYSIQTNLLESKVYTNNKEQLKSEELFEHDSDMLLISRFKRNSTGSIIDFETNEYHNGLLSRKICEDSLYQDITYTYNGEVLIKELNNNNGQDYFIRYEYDFDNNEVYRIWKHEPDSTLINYTVFTDYSNEYQKESLYNSNNDLSKWWITHVSDNRHYREHYNAEGNLLQTEVDTYENGQLNSHLVRNSDNEEEYRINYYYFN